MKNAGSGSRSRHLITYSIEHAPDTRRSKGGRLNRGGWAPSAQHAAFPALGPVLVLPLQHTPGMPPLLSLPPLFRLNAANGLASASQPRLNRVGIAHGSGPERSLALRSGSRSRYGRDSHPPKPVTKRRYTDDGSGKRGMLWCHVSEIGKPLPCRGLPTS